jgi:patatin-like phospholipase/acyl hydrolase
MSVATILSIDGGGIRGLIPARVLAEIEARTARPVHALFDIVAGTSTGGILSLALTRPDRPGGTAARWPAAELVDLYLRHGPEIFSRSLWRRLSTLWSLLRPRYDGVALERVLRQYLEEYRLHDALTRVVVTAYDTEGPAPAFFKSWRALPPESGFTGPAVNRWDFRMWEVARATAAAPTYFPPLRLPDLAPGGRPMTLLDGGVFAANPGMCALADAQVLFPRSDLYVVSLGTGNTARPIPWDTARRWGLAGWARPIIDVLMDGVSDTVEYQLRELLPAALAGAHHRLQIPLAGVNDDMDDASPSNMAGLVRVAERLIAERTAEIDRVCRDLLDAQGRRPGPAA